jgi:predicted CXXCH cytochrome family protein
VAIAALAGSAWQCGGGSGGSGGGSQTGPFPDGFLGLVNVPQNVTQCGECHANEQGRWAQTAHADAYQTLAAIGREGPDQSCAPCHNISANGNALMDPMTGFIGTPVAELHNVQCESCHGPGAAHVSDVKQHPDASLTVSLSNGCGECHQGAHQPFVDEWMESAHAQSHLTGAEFGLNVAGDPECAYCHVTQSFIRFVETDGVEQIITANPEPINCIACHDPHGNGNEHQVRVIGDQPIVCGQCHNQGPSMIGDTPHHPQRDVLLGNAGFEFPGEVFPTNSTHGDLDLNPDLCVTCHVVKSPFQGGEFPIPAQVGHTFTPIPVINEATGERNFSNCQECHTDPASTFNSFRAEIDPLAADLQAAIDAVPEAQRGTEAYEGALFNLQTFEGDKSHGVHNPNRMRRLLQVSIEKLSEL